VNCAYTGDAAEYRDSRFILHYVPVAERHPSLPYQQTADAALAALGSDPRHGLSEAEARSRREKHGRNELTAEKPIPAWRKFVAQFTDVLVLLLMVAAAISAAIWWYEREAALPYEALAIFAIVLLNAVMGFVQEARAEASLAKLRAMSAAEATVLREGNRRRVAAAELVPGDVIMIEDGWRARPRPRRRTG
jgi:Ca2+-transporting ATPase